MKLIIQRKLDRIVGPLLCGIFSLLPGRHRPLPEKFKPRRILVVLLSEMGSLVLARPMFDRIRSKYPEAAVHVLLFEQNREVFEILDEIPKDHILSIDPQSMAGFLMDSLRVVVRMRKMGIDAAIDCELFSRISSIYSFLSGAQIRAGFHAYTQEGLYRGRVINRPVPYNPYQHISQQYLTLVEALESCAVPGVKRRVSSVPYRSKPAKIPKGDIEKLAVQMGHDFPQIGAKKLILMYPGGGLLPIRAWPLENFRRVAGEFCKAGFAVGIIGLDQDRHLAEGIVRFCGDSACINLTGYTRTVRDLLGLFHLAVLLVTNDGGPGHFASLTPVPAAILFGPETPVLYGSLDRKAFHFYRPLSCSPCLTAYNHRNSPCDGDNVCLKSIDPEEVLAKCYELLGHKADS